MSDTIVRTEPRLAERRSGGRRPEELVALLPPVLLEQLGAKHKARQEHQRVAERYGELRAALPLAQAALKRAQDEEGAALRSAMKAGRREAGKATNAVAEAEQVLEKVAGELREAEVALDETSAALLSASTEHVRAAGEEAERRETAALDLAEQRIAEAIEVLGTAGQLAAERTWLSRFAATGEVSPFGRSSAGRHASVAEVEQALARLRESRQRRLERVAEAEHEELALNVTGAAGSALRRLPLPPGTETWLLPGEPQPDVEPVAAEAAD